ncbi:hypothetical protein N0V88_001692 [Collariella sp. IMI 366227]|nr:hypothetical protein N0V88_001692 [Collariella sp. IMI 366227]
MPSLDEAWNVARKLAGAISKELDQIEDGDQGANVLARFEKVEKLMANYRLACIETIWIDPRAANEKKAEEGMWTTHALVTKTYRAVLAKSQGTDHIVFKRKLEKLYSTYLKTAQYFYKGYLQRICARYNMKDLRRIARQAGINEMAVPDKDKVDPAATQLEDIVRKSYRTLLRSKDRKWDGPLSYYLLANDLIPDSGYGHHQCGMIFIGTEDYLQVVYHLYCAYACKYPHPNAWNNLKRALNDIKSRKCSASKHALLTWFVKLHAFYAQGKVFAERKELESEVDNRLAVAMKTGTGYGSDLDLLKIVVINITAYVTAQDRISKEWTEEGSQFCEFTLLLNVRMVHAITRLLGDEIADLMKRRNAEARTGSSSASAKGEALTNFTPAFNRTLPLLRVYMTWLCSYGSQLVKFRPHLEPHFGNMCTALSNTLTLLFNLMGSGEPKLGDPVSWRFPEDDMTLGIQCLNGPEIHDGCQLYYDTFTHKPKPRREEVPDNDKHTEDDVTFTRALDILLCALDLSGTESKFPIISTTVVKDSREQMTFVFLEGGKPEPVRNVLPVQHPTTSTVAPAIEQPPQRPMEAPSPCESNALSEDRDFYGPNLEKDATGVSNGRARSAVARTPTVSAALTAQTALTAPVSEFPIERQLFHILNDFLIPPEHVSTSKPETPNRPVARTNHGMDSAAVAAAFGNGSSASPAPGSAGTKAFPTLPWDYFYTPAPPGGNPGASGPVPNWGANSSGFSRPASSGRLAQPGAGAAAGNPLMQQAHQRYPSMGQSTLVDSQVDALRTLSLGLEQGYGAANGRLSTNPLQQSQTQAQNPWGPSANPWQTTYGNQAHAPATTTTTTGRVPTSPFSTFDFTQTPNLPQANSPWGLPAAQRFASGTQSPTFPSHLRPSSGYHPGTVPSPLAAANSGRYASAGGAYATTGMALGGGEQGSQAAGVNAWNDARQRPRSGVPNQGFAGGASAGRGDPWGGSGVRKVDGNGVVQGLPKR